MSLPESYEEIIQKVGWVGQPLVLFDKRVTRSGIRRLLMDIAESRVNLTDHPPEWAVLWRRIEWTRHIARTVLHVNIPPKLWAEERARLAAKIAAMPEYDQRGSTEEKERALRWTRRR